MIIPHKIIFENVSFRWKILFSQLIYLFIVDYYLLSERDRVPQADFLRSVEPDQASGPGSLGGAAVWHLPLAQGAIVETRDRVPRRAPGAWSLLLPLPMSPPLSLSLSLCDYHK